MKKNSPKKQETGITLNSYLAQTGLCSRRKAVEYIKEGEVQVNYITVTEPGYRVEKNDKISYKKMPLELEKKLYILLNKPKGYICTVSDEKGRKTVLELVEHFSSDRLYPVGRLDRATTGLLVITNDGHFAQKLAHPRFKVSKVYVATLDKPVSPLDIQKFVDGFELEDGFIAANHAQYLGSNDHVEIEMLSGRNRIVRRMFEYLGYKVIKLDRTRYAQLSKKNLPQGQARLLTEQEIEELGAVHFKKA